MVVAESHQIDGQTMPPSIQYYYTATTTPLMKCGKSEYENLDDSIETCNQIKAIER